MKYKQFVLGVLVSAGLGAVALETIPLTFKEGDVISAGTMNAIFARVNMITKMPKREDLVGAWDCVETVTSPTTLENYTFDRYYLIGTRRNRLEFGSPDVEGVMSLQGDYKPFALSFDPYNPGRPQALVGSTAIMGQGTRLLVLAQLEGELPFVARTTLTYLDQDRLEFDLLPHSGTVTIGSMSCVKTNAAPAPANALTVLVTGTNVRLMWVDQSGTETGFRIEQKTSAEGTWAVLQTASANATELTLTNVVPGTYWYRVVAFNAVGDAMASNEVQVTVTSTTATPEPTTPTTTTTATVTQ